MSSTNDPDINEISSKDNKYHVSLMYSIDEDGYYYGSYRDESFQIAGFFQTKTHEDMLKQCYDSFSMCMEYEKEVPFNVDDIENSVVFDEIKCENSEEKDLAYSLHRTGKGFNEIMEALDRIDEDGYYYGSYRDTSFQHTGFFQTKTHEDMLKQCYDTFSMRMEYEKEVPFNVDDIENSVVFDEIKCETREDKDLAFSMKSAGKGSKEIMEALDRESYFEMPEEAS
ncbi:unnamed protein product [Adineta steineri]|uniref:Uncharacterized protein n=2 Tax=Adineta steineri TaxID=433720 RepID=A0A813P6Q3_9BILA|nr:unnamed protein product [Adineta steineri]CAF0745846.1 unnamed protein product [Adineta steineri]CAF3488084.1 unnamed protein product [Adineta steineri]CAF3950628.1 unnamed protein product [Adineta steineri]